MVTKNPRNNNRQSVSRIVRSIIENKAEKKYYTFTPASATAALAAGVVLNVTRDLVEGDNVEQRAGRKIQNHDCHMRYSITLPAAGLSGVIRLIWVADQLNTGTLPAVTDILDSASVTSFMSLASIANGRFSVLSDKSYNMVVSAANQHVYDHITVRKKSNIFYNGSTAVNTANGKGSQFLLVITDLAANAPIYTADYSMRYVDL